MLDHRSVGLVRLSLRPYHALHTRSDEERHMPPTAFPARRVEQSGRVNYSR
jgi:hypothetical protein